jgi:4-hydroxybenzoate polyprenyltransferase
VRTAVAGMGVTLAVFLAAAALLSPLCLLLSPLALGPLVLYPYGKRFTWGCHFILGVAQAAAPVGAWIAVTGEWSWAAAVLGLAVGSWIAGFDLIYSCQDVESDRREGVHSLPARFGVAAALRVSVAMHVATFVLLLAFGVAAGFGDIWNWGVLLTCVALCYEHYIVKPHDLSRVNRAFFTVNGYVGIGLLLFAVADLVDRGLRT